MAVEFPPSPEVGAVDCPVSVLASDLPDGTDAVFDVPPGWVPLPDRPADPELPGL